MPSGAWLLAVVTLQRLLELAWSQRNTRRLLAEGAVEAGAAHYPWLVAYHVLWLAALWVLGWDASLEPFWTGIYALLQVFRAWVLLTLGRRWTTRVIVARTPLVARGPYRFLRHPNYAVVVGEVAVLPLALQAPVAALVLSLVHLPILAIRIRAEDRALGRGLG